MAITLIRKKINNEWNNLMFRTEIVTVDKVDRLILKVTIVDKTLKPLSHPLKYDFDSSLSEETYHKELRKNAAKVGQLITSHSTNPEWNPENYCKNLEDCKDEN